MEDDTGFIKKVTHVIHTHLADTKLNGAFIAQELGTNRMQLHRKLKAHIGLHTSGYITELRMKHAQHLLQSTSLSIAEIATICGYADYRYFSKTFKKEVGCLPSEFRNS